MVPKLDVDGLSSFACSLTQLLIKAGLTGPCAFHSGRSTRMTDCHAASNAPATRCGRSRPQKVLTGSSHFDYPH